MVVWPFAPFKELSTHGDVTDHLLNLRKAIDRLYHHDSGRTEAYMDALRELEAVDLELADAQDRIDELALALAAERRRAAELEAALRERFFSELPEYDYERYDGIWGWHEHPWFELLGLTDEECQAALAENKPAEFE